MHLEGLAKFEKDRVLTEIPPEKDDKGEVTEVQVLEEGELPDGFYVAGFDPESSWRNWNSFNRNALDVKYP